MRTRTLLCALAVSAAVSPVFCQTTPVATTAATVIPALIRYDGVGPSSVKAPVLVTFLIFKEESGGDPLWTETQTVTLDPAGKYEVYLGATNASGLPFDLFKTGEARWLDVQVAGEKPQARVLLTSVPYALKAADAATLGGLPASAFVLAGSQVAALASAGAASVSPAASSTVTTSGGTKNYVPLFSGSNTIANSEIYDTGTSVGIGDIPNATAKLDVNGPMIMRGNMTVSRTANATASSGHPSYGFAFYSNVYNSSTKEADNPHFVLQSEPTGNNTSNTGATFNLLYSNKGAAAAETGLSINPSGVIKFAAGQTFNLSSSAGIAVDGSSSSGTGVEGTSSSGDGVFGNTGGSVVNTAGVLGNAGGTSGFGGIAGVWGDAYNHVGVLGTSQQYAGVEGISASGPGLQGSSTSAQGVEGDSTSGNGVHGVSQSTSGIFGETSSNSTADAALYGFSHGVAMGVYGYSAFANGVSGSSYQYDGVYGVSSVSNGVGGQTTDANTDDDTAGVYGYSSTAQVGVEGQSAAGIGGYFTGGANSTGGAGLNSTGGSGSNNGGDGIDAYGGAGTGSGAGGYGGQFRGGDGPGAGGIAGTFVGGLPTTPGGEYGDGLIVAATRSTTDTSGYSLFVNSIGGGQTTYISFFGGSVTVEGELDAELPSVKIDHPADPANKYLVHASVQSSEMMNMYTGNVVTDELGLATVALPDWFESLNTDFRYQLTVLGQFAQAIVKQKVANGKFIIMTNAPHVEVSWQITAVRNDAFAKANPLVVEREKPVGERGFYQHPELFGQPAEKKTEWGMRPALMRSLKEKRTPVVRKPVRQVAVSRSALLPGQPVTDHRN